MSRQTFFANRGPFSVEALAECTGARPPEGADLSRMIADVAPVTACGPEDVTFVTDRAHMLADGQGGAGACFVAAELADRIPADTVALVADHPDVAFAAAVAAFYPDAVRDAIRSGATPAAPVDPTARLEDGVELEPGVVIGPRVEIGAGSYVGANTVICAGVRIGRGCAIGPGVTIMHALIGNNVIIHPGVRIGQDGFGYARGPRGMVKMPQIGRVIIQNDVEIGANSAVDRGALEDTVVGAGTKIDNLVQIAHNVTTGLSCVIAGHTGISGSVKIGNGVLIGGKVGIKQHVTIGDGAELGGGSAVITNVPAGTRVYGNPQRPVDQFAREMRAVARLARGDRKAAKDET